MESYLKEESFYSDRYDIGTIEQCLHSIESWREKMSKKQVVGKAPSEEQKLQVMNLFLYFLKGDRFKKRASFVRECMNRDQERDELLRNASKPSEVRCPNCFGGMEVMSKELHENMKGLQRVLFLLECPACKKHKGFFEDGEEFRAEPQPCPKCGKSTKTSCEEKGQSLVWITKCLVCGFTETEVDDFEKGRIEREKRQEHESEMLAMYRAEFCLSSAEGEDYLQAVRNMEALQNIVKLEDLRQTDPDYKKAKDVKKLTVFELAKTLAEAMEKQRYLKLSFEKPEIGRYIIIPFSSLDADSSRKEVDSARKLQRIIKDVLSETNWRLMTEGVSYKLGYLSGRLKGYESEEDLVQLIKS